VSAFFHAQNTRSQSLQYIKTKRKDNGIMKITMENIRVMRYAELINQRKIARLLASLVNCGLKILITTHSDYVLREFNHLILLTGKSPHLKKIVKEKGYKDLELLTSSQVRLYTAEEGHVLLPNYKRKTKVKTLVEIPIDDAGIPRSDFDDVINEMNRITDDIVFGG